MVIGSHEALGNWEVMDAIEMTRQGSTNEFVVSTQLDLRVRTLRWQLQAQVWLEDGVEFEYKYLVLGGTPVALALGKPRGSVIVWSSDPKSRVTRVPEQVCTFDSPPSIRYL